MDTDGSDRLARIEKTLEVVAAAVRASGEKTDSVETSLRSVAESVQRQGETTARGFDALTSMLRLLDARMAVLEARMTDVIAELRNHTHEAA